MSAVVRSVNVGRREALAGGTRRPSGITKQPVAAVAVADPGVERGTSGVSGDFLEDFEHHGGSSQAVYAFAREELDWWAAELGRELTDGLFGENLTLDGVDVDGARVGDRWRVGEALLEVSGPRIPCSTFAAAMGEPHWVRRFAEHGRPGAYLSVVEPGTIRPGDPVEVVSRAAHDVDIPTMLRAFLGDPEAAAAALAAGVVRARDAEKLRAVADRSAR